MGNAYCEALQTTELPFLILTVWRPSKDALAELLLADSGKWTSITAVSGTTIGLNDKLCGATGVINVHGTDGATIGPPALIE
jgi:hypothetical protein